MNRKGIISFTAVLLLFAMGFSSCYVERRGRGPRHHHHHRHHTTVIVR